MRLAARGGAIEGLVILLLCGAVVWLWLKLRELEQRLARFEALRPTNENSRDTRIDQGLGQAPTQGAAPAPPPSPASPGDGLRKPAIARVVQSAKQTRGIASESARAPAADTQPAWREDAQRAARDDQPAAPSSPRFAFDFEDIFGRRLPIWGGGIALAIAGLFLVRYSIESGLMTPLVRVGGAFAFGLALVAGAEWVHRRAENFSDPRIPQALAGAGLATLYAGFYLAGSLYGLIGQGLAFLGLAAVTAAAIALSFRFGLPCAILGLVGGFAAPLLVGSGDANLPLLALYLGLVSAGLVATGQRQSRPWLSLAALALGLGWGGALLLAEEFGAGEVLALGLYLIVLGAILPALVSTASSKAAGMAAAQRPARLGSALVASVQLALLVDKGGYSPLAWGLYLLLGAALATLGWRRKELREMGAIAAAVSVLLLSQWHAPAPPMFAAVSFGLAAIFAGASLAHLWRASAERIDLAQLAAVPLALAIVAVAKFAPIPLEAPNPKLALGLCALSALPLLGAWRLWAAPCAKGLALLLLSGGLLVFGGLTLALSGWAAVIAAAVVFAGLFAVLGRRDEEPLHAVLWVFAGLSALAVLSAPDVEAELSLLFGRKAQPDVVRASVRWLAACVPWALLWWRSAEAKARNLAQVLAAVMAYGLIAQWLPAFALAWAAALLAIGLRYSLPIARAAQFTLMAIVALWSLTPLLEWTREGLAALAGEPMLVGDVSTPLDIAKWLAPAALVFALIRVPIGALRGAQGWRDSRALGATLALIAAHMLFKQVFQIDSRLAFIQFGFAERTLWEGLLLGGALAALWRTQGDEERPAKLWRALAGGLALLAFAHAAWFSGLVHNPLWSEQAVGPTPLANLALAFGAVSIGAAMVLRSLARGRVRDGLDAAIMALAGLSALMLLRQIFAGSVLSAAPVGQIEDLLRSLLGIVLALVFLALGRLRNERSWRIGSLAIMLIAVAKVFLWDAAGLGGLLRIASFMALGFSLIAIGWVYARQLKREPHG